MARNREGKKIHYTHWTSLDVSALALTAGSVASTGLVAVHEPETLLRVRGNLLAYVDGVSVPGGLTRVVCGLIPVSEGTGTTVLWSPLTDGDAPWMWIETFCLGSEESVVDAVGVQGVGIYRSVVDSKAMRIMRNQELQFVIEQTTLGSVLAINAILTSRVLSGTG